MLNNVLENTPQHYKKAFDQFVYNHTHVDSEGTYKLFMVRFYNKDAKK